MLTYDWYGAALGLFTDLGADTAKSLTLAGPRRRGFAVKVSQAKDIDLATLRDGVEQPRRAEVGSGLATSDAVAVAVDGGSSEGGGEEENDGGELHFGVDYLMYKEDIKSDGLLSE
jgi:hypothetical protein